MGGEDVFKANQSYQLKSYVKINQNIGKSET